MGHEERIKLWVDPEFRRAVYKIKAEDPNRTIMDITRDLGRGINSGSIFSNTNKKKNDTPFFGKI